MKEHLKSKWYYYIGGLILFIIILIEAKGRGDFNIFMSASTDFLSGKNIYKIQYNDYYHYYYDVVFAMILAPFTFLPLYLVKVIWLLLNVFFVYRIWQILMNWLPVSQMKKGSKALFIFLSFAFILSLLRDNFHYTQMTIFIVYLILEGIAFINSNRPIAGSILIALGITIKILPVVIIPYLIYRKEWKSAMSCIVFIVALLCLPILFIGFDYNKFLLTERWHLINPTNQEHILDTAERSFHSLTTLFATLFVKDCGDLYALPLRRNIADISIENLNLIINAVRGALVIFMLYFLRTMPFKRIASNLQRLYEISYLCLIIPLIFPHQQHYSFFFIFPASTYLLFYLITQFFNKENEARIASFKLKKVTLIVFLSISYFLINSHFILGQFNQIYDHYKTLTYGVLILMIVLAICRPDKLKSNLV